MVTCPSYLRYRADNEGDSILKTGIVLLVEKKR